MNAPRVGLLHTVPALARTFTDLVQPGLSDATMLHIVDAELLATAVRVGVTPEVSAQVAAHVSYLAAAGCRAVLVTCSSIGEAADAAGSAVHIPVLRVDRPMVEEAIRVAMGATVGGRRARIAVLATLEATLGPSMRLVKSSTRDTGIDVSYRVVEGAAAARARGELATHDRLIAAAVELEATSADVIILAQASMAEAARGAATKVSVLTSPASGAAALVAAATAAIGRHPAEGPASAQRLPSAASHDEGDSQQEQEGRVQ
jgi:aspartate/glutamate racemase